MTLLDTLLKVQGRAPFNYTRHKPGNWRVCEKTCICGPAARSPVAPALSVDPAARRRPHPNADQPRYSMGVADHPHVRRSDRAEAVTPRPSLRRERSRRSIFFLAALLLCAGCSTIGNPVGSVALTDAGARVQMRSNAIDVKGCAYLGEVAGADDVNVFDDVREENAIKRLKNAAGEKGADTVLVVSTSNKGSRQHGEAYRCGQSKP